ncbi:ABC transporter ATP-binding protein [Radicibacter daui]|uniref:ABC transporter ATP-binding protein n=1 Tax=Radicibacter daui TaxID=3064829 RepID=UPI00404702C3
MPASPSPAAQNPVVRVSDLHVTLASAAGPVNILRGIDLEVEAGETVSIVGPSGSGKSTLMMVIGGLERASSGSIEIAGQPLGGLGEDALALLRRDHIGIVFQDFHLVPTMTALENVALPLELAGADDAFARAEAELKAVGLGHRLTHYPAQLSGGEQQRVALARAAAPRPSLLLADEPTGNLDGSTGHIIIELLFERARSSGSTLVLITHDPQLAERCGRQIAMRDGIVEKDSRAGSAAA